MPKSTTAKRTLAATTHPHPPSRVEQVLAQLAAGRADARCDLPPYFGPRTHREMAAAALEELRAKAGGQQ